MNTLLQTLRTLGPLRLAALAGVGAGLVGLFAYLTSNFATTDMALLYGDLEAGDSSQIVSRLESMNVPFDLRADGSAIFVPAAQALRLRMAMAEEGLPSGGSVGYEIFDRTDTLGTTNFVQQVNHLRALEGELARTIRTISAVRSARVHLVIPERELFARERPEPSASIILITGPRAALEKPQVLAIQHLVAAAVPGLKPSAISIVDSQGTLLARGTEDGGVDATGATGEELRSAFEGRTTRMIEDLLQRSLGYGNVRAEVSAEMDFDRITTNSEIYDPDGQVVRSTQTVEENSDSNEGAAPDPVSVAGNLPDPTLADPGALQTNSRSARTEETVNYEISKKVETHVREAGKIRRLSVAVLVDGTYQAAPDGTTTYVPRSAEELAQVDKLVRSAIGFDPERGDSVEVVNMRFVDPEEGPASEDDELLLGFERADIRQMVELGIVGVVAVLFLLLVVRPLVPRLLEARAAASEPQGLLTDARNLPPALAAPTGALVPAEPERDALASEIDQMIDINQVEGRVKASSLRKIGEIVEKHPEEAVNIMRNWMYQQS